MKIGETFTDDGKTYECIGEASGYPVCKLVTKKAEEVKTEAPKRRTRKTSE